MNQSEKSNSWIVDINDHSVILVQGIDAVKFLQGQVTCDIEALLSSSNRRPSSLGSHCTHKGRMLFTFRAFCLDNNAVILIVHRELIPQIKQNLDKYIVFSKAELIDGQSDYQLLGIEGETAVTLLKQFVPNLSDQVDVVSLNGPIMAICLGPQRYEILLNNKSGNEESPHETIYYRDNLDAVCEPKSVDFWTLGNIQSGIGEVRSETVEEFIPQMLNLQAVANGVSFDKGCYTGQEIVARMKYLGKLKRQMYRLKLEACALPNPGDSIYSPSAKKPVGTVVIACHADGFIELLAVVINTVIEEDMIYIDNSYRYELKLLPLPYAMT